jgi:hypothetical protein
MNLTEIGCEDVDWTDVTQNWDVTSVVNTAMKLPVPKVLGSYLRCEQSYHRLRTRDCASWR